MNILKEQFFKKDVVQLAEDILGKKIQIGYLEGIINETEAYNGHNDPASHAAKGETKRNYPMFQEGGRTYVYLIYGMYFCFNITSGEIGIPGAVLIRSIIPTKSIDIMKKNRNYKKDIANGPGKLSQAMNINYKLNNIKINNNYFNLFLLDNNIPKKYTIISTTRVGISKGTNKKRRFILKEKS